MNSLNVFRAVMAFLVSKPKCLRLKSPPTVPYSEAPAPPDPASFESYFPAALLDATGWLNILESQSPASVLLLARCAEKALTMLTRPVAGLEVFAALFSGTSHPLAICDYFLEVWLPDDGEPILDKDLPLWR